MTEENKNAQLDEVQQQLLESLDKADTSRFKQLLVSCRNVNFVDDDGISCLAFASFKGNREAVELLLDLGADINLNKHCFDYTPLHFAALSGNTHVCRQLLEAGIWPGAINSVQRTAAQMAAFVGNYTCVDTINNYVTKSSLEYYTQPHGQQTEPQIPPSLLQSFHAFVTEIKLTP